MEITETKSKSEYNDDIKKLNNIFKFKSEEMKLKGSSNLKAINYFNDYDFFTEIKRNYNESEIYDEFKGILRSIIENIDCYFIEFKVQSKDGKKSKWFPNELFKKEEFEKVFDKDKIDYCKLDLVYFSENRFIEASCNYVFNKDKLKSSDVEKELSDDIKEFKKDNNYYKILKRMYSIYRNKGENNKLLLLTNFFNSEIGEFYKKKSNVEAIDLIKKYYPNDALTKKRIEVNLQELKYNSNEFNKKNKELNSKAKTIYNNL